MANTVASTSTTETAPEDLTGDTHVHYDVGYKAAFAEIASLFEDIQADLRIVTDRADDQSKGMHVRKADSISNNPANIAAQAALIANLGPEGLAVVNAELASPTDFGNTSATNYQAMRGGKGFIGGGAPQAPGYGGTSASTITTSTGVVIATNNAELNDLVESPGTATGNVKYNNQGAKRDLPIQQKLMDILQTAAVAAKVDVLINSGGQVPKSEGGVDGVNRTGSNRHDKGYASDVALYVPDFNGRKLSSNSAADLAIMILFMRECKDAGATSVGQGNGYMGDTGIHVDISWLGQQAGKITGITSNRTWGGGSANYALAPTYMKDLMAPRANT